VQIPKEIRDAVRQLRRAFITSGLRTMQIGMNVLHDGIIVDVTDERGNSETFLVSASSETLLAPIRKH
jgi:uncharacterized protein YbcI